MSPLLETRDLNVRIANRSICKNLDFSLQAGQCWAMLGINGAGKTTLLHTLAGLRQPLSGEIIVDRLPLPHLSRRTLAQFLGVLFQESQDPFPSTVLETALIGRHPYTKSWQWEGANDYQIAMESLTLVGLRALAERQINTLSGGERQRLAVANLLTQSPRVFLLDEPTNHLDLQYQHLILRLFKSYADDSGCAVVMILHDINLAATYCDHAMLLYTDEEPLCGPCSDLLTESNLSNLYQYPIQKITGPHGRPLFMAL